MTNTTSWQIRVPAYNENAIRGDISGPLLCQLVASKRRGPESCHPQYTRLRRRTQCEPGFRTDGKSPRDDGSIRQDGIAFAGRELISLRALADEKGQERHALDSPNGRWDGWQVGRFRENSLWPEDPMFSEGLGTEGIGNITLVHSHLSH